MSVISRKGAFLPQYALSQSNQRRSYSSLEIGRNATFHITLVPASGSFASTIGNGSPATYPIRLRRSGVSRTWLEYFSVESLYGGGQSICSVGVTLIVMPCKTRRYCPGERR